MSPELYENIRDWDPTWNGPVMTMPDCRFWRWFTGVREGDDPWSSGWTGWGMGPAGTAGVGAAGSAGPEPAAAVVGSGPVVAREAATMASMDRSPSRGGDRGRCWARLRQAASAGAAVVSSLLVADPDRVSRIEW